MSKSKSNTLGICNICGELSNLTDDHTPPKGSITITSVEIKHITSRLSDYPDEHKGRISQNGVKYKSLCPRCNNEILGLKCDPTFNNFINTIKNHLMSPNFRQGILPIKTYPQKIMRSVIGHLSAQGVDRYDKGINSEVIKNYLLDLDAPLPSDINIYYWFFPYKGFAMARDVAITYAASNVEPCCMWFIKFSPIGFIVTFDKPDNYRFMVNELSKFRDTQFNEERTVYFDLENIPNHMWPEAPMNNTMLLYGEQAITSYLHKRS